MASTQLKTGPIVNPQADVVSPASTIGAINAEVVIDCAGASTLTFDARGTFVATLQLAATVDGTNWVDLPVIVDATGAYAAAATTAGIYAARASGFLKARVRCTAYTSGAAIVTLVATPGVGSTNEAARLEPSNLVVRTLGAANASAVATLAAAGVGLYHIVTSVQINVINASATGITASAVISSTQANLPGSVAWTWANGIAAWTDRTVVNASWPAGLKAVAANTASSITVPALGAGVQAEIIVTYRVGR